MNTKDFFKICADIVSAIDKKHEIERTPQLAFTQLIEEIGELAKDVNMPALRKKDPDKDNLAGEFADVLLQLVKLAEMHNVDLEKAVEKKIEILKERGYL